MTFGIIDVGTNSIHLVIGILGLHGSFHTIFRQRRLTRLGEGGLAKKKLAQASMRRAQKALKDYARILKRFSVDHIDAVATSAVRGASNGSAFVNRIRRLGIPLRTISGNEEARLIYLGVTQSARLTRSTMIVSLGGGSAQVTIGDGHKLQLAASLPLGCARLAEQFIRRDPPRKEELYRLRQAVWRSWGRIVPRVRRYRWHHVVGSSAMIQQVLVAASSSPRRRHAPKKQDPSVTRRQLRKFIQRLTVSTAAKRRRLPGVDPKREDLLLPAAITLLIFMEACGVIRIRHAPGSLREGLVVDYLFRHHQPRSPRPFDSVAEHLRSMPNGQLTAPSHRRMMRHRGKKAVQS